MSARRVWAIGVALLSLAATFVLVSAGSPIAGCYQCDYPCPPAFDLGPFCTTPTGSNQASSCLVDGVPVVQCTPDSCGPWTLPSGSTLTIPVGTMWSTLGPRDNLHWFVACLPPGSETLEASAPESSVEEASMQDGSAPEGSIEESSVEDSSTQDASTAFVSTVPQMAGTLTVLFDGVPAQGCVCTAQTEITCENVPHSVQTLGFLYVQAPAPPVDGGPEGGSEAGSDASSDAASDAASEAGPDAAADGGSDSGVGSLVLTIAFDVGECMPTHGGCPQSDVPEVSAY